jgi:hypothetical protein
MAIEFSIYTATGWRQGVPSPERLRDLDALLHEFASEMTQERTRKN